MDYIRRLCRTGAGYNTSPLERESFIGTFSLFCFSIVNAIYVPIEVTFNIETPLMDGAN